MTDTTDKPSEAAMEAAERMHDCGLVAWDVSEVERAARIIDEETHSARARLAEALVRIAITKTDWAGNYAAFGAWAEAVAVNALKDAGMYEAALREAGGEA